MQTKRTTFPTSWLPYALIGPQVVITLIFFIWPAGQALYQSVLRQDAFGLRTTFVGLENFRRLFADPIYVNSLQVTFTFAVGTTLLSMSVALLFAVMVNKLIRRDGYTTILVWPYAVAPAIAGILWWFIFNPTIGIMPFILGQFGYSWNHRASSTDAMILVVIAAAWKQISYNFIFFLAGLQSIPHSLIEAAAIDGASPDEAVLDHRLPAPLADHLLPAGDQRRLRDVRHLRHHPRDDARRPGAGDQHPRLQGLHGRLRRPEPRLVGGAVGDPDVDRRRADGDPVPLHRAQGAVLMVENRPWQTFFTHLILILGVTVVVFPVYVAFIASTQAPGSFLRGIIPLTPGTHLVENYSTMLGRGLSRAGAPPLDGMMLNSLIMALAIAVGKIAISIVSAFAIVYFRFPFRLFFFWMIFLTLMLPVEVRIFPTYQVIADLGC
jgi:ABC-type glycerol-3-phosphate transport system permease component